MLSVAEENAQEGSLHWSVADITMATGTQYTSLPPLSPGQAVFQIEKLETHSELRATLDLLDEKGRKPVGGNMEVVARLREPFTGKLVHPHTSTRS